MKYQANWASLNARPVPAWFGEAKFGIFIHWGLYSVPAWAPRDQYAEWYGWHIQEPGSPYAAFHNRVYGGKRYADFVKDFTAEMFDADAWVKLFKASGAKYINFVSKHHDGFCLFPSSYAPFWNSVDIGPHRDFCAEIKNACEKEGLRFGVYHSVYEWWHPLYLQDPERYAVEHLIPMMKELIERYQPNTLFTDGEWDHPSSVWHSAEFLQWLYNESSVREIIVPNDRWGSDTRGALGGNFTTEYGEVGFGRQLTDCRPFEECRGIGHSFGYNRMEEPEDYLSVKELLTLLVTLVSRGGNLLLNIGPEADGTIPAIMKERLLGMGEWLRVNGEAIYATTPYTDDRTEGEWYTRKGNTVYCIMNRYPAGEMILDRIPYDPEGKAELLGCAKPLEMFDADGRTGIRFPVLIPDDIECADLYTIRIRKPL